MRQKNLLSAILFSGLGVMSFTGVTAQVIPHSSYSGNLDGTRFVVTEPATIYGLKKVNYAPWGTLASPTIVDAVVEKAYDTLGATTLLNGTGSYPALTGKFALIFRGGGISFSDKVNRCISKGATGVIIVNNVPGDPVGMSPTPAGSTASVPVMMISDVDGQAISDQIKAGATVKVTIGSWTTGATHDLGIVSAFQNIPHALNIPLHQMTGSGATEAFKHYVGGAVANYGSSDETGITVVDSVFWTPTSGTASFVTSKSYSIPSLKVADSVAFGFGAAGSAYSLTVPTTTGRYDFRHSLTYDSTDEVVADNQLTISQYISDSIYCKGAYDYANHRPVITMGIRPGVTGSPITFYMGNTFYVKNGGYAARNLQFSISINDVPTLDGKSSYIYLYKWNDGAVAKDSFMQAGELTAVGQGAVNFTTADSSGDVFTVPFLDIDNPASGKPVIVEDNTWYIAMAEIPAPCFVGVYQRNSFFARSYAQWKQSGSVPGGAVYDIPVGLWADEKANFETLPENSLAPYPFCLANSFAIDSINFDLNTSLPAFGLLMSKDKPNSLFETPGKEIGQVNVFPNPADKGNITVAVNLITKSKKVEYRLTDVLGRALQAETHYNVLNEQFQMNTAKYPTGNYFLTILTDDGFTSRKLVIRN